MTSKARIVLVQADLTWEDPTANLKNLDAMLSDTALQPSDIVVLPEMFSTGFSMNAETIATSRDGSVVEWMRRFAGSRKVHVLGSHAEKENGRIFNAAVVIAPDGTVQGAYRKIHLFQDEQNHYSSGDKLLLLQLCGVTAAVFICYDLRFPEVFRAASTHGAQLFFVVASWPAVRQGHWDLLLHARAIENQAFVCGCNRTGRDPNQTYAGGSCVIGPSGNTISRLDASPQTAVVELDFEEVSTLRKKFDCLSDRRPLLYEQLSGPTPSRKEHN